jgi:NAD(P)H-hydrate epimerase
MNCSGVPILAVDVPSGINVDTGEEFGESVWATHTVTFGLPKPYLFQGIGLEHAGTWSIADIGLPPALTKEPTDAFLIEGWWVRNLLPERLRSCHKGDNGHVLVVAGSQRMPGAALLVARAALRAGAGLVTLASTPFVCEIVACHLPEVIYLPLPEIDGVIHPEASRVLLDSQERFNSAVFGPGLSQHSAIPEMLAQTWKSWERPSCIDADALNAVSTGTPLPPAVSVLTPHPGEMSRLLHCSTAEIRADRFNTVRTACERFRKTVLLKGAYSIVGEDTQILAVNSTGNPGMAAAGMGDVLSGVIGKLLAQDLPSYDAAVCGMYWHGLAADMCAEEIGEIGFRASEVAEMLPKARSRINRMHQQAIS